MEIRAKIITLEEALEAARQGMEKWVQPFIVF